MNYPDKQKNLVLLMEELAELQQVLAKIYRFGPGGKMDNLLQELGDVEACLQIVRSDYGVEQYKVIEASANKLRKLEKYYD